MVIAPMGTSYILTAEMDAESFTWLDALRREHFPPERNLLPAHLTLFHRLSPMQTGRLYDLCLPQDPVPLLFEAPFLLGSGVAIRVRLPGIGALRAAARETMGGEFSRQDSRGWRPHITVQNKVTPNMARQVHRTLETGFVPRAGAATALLVWEYLGGPWKLAARLPFQPR